MAEQDRIFRKPSNALPRGAEYNFRIYDGRGQMSLRQRSMREHHSSIDLEIAGRREPSHPEDGSLQNAIKADFEAYGNRRITPCSPISPGGTTRLLNSVDLTMDPPGQGYASTTCLSRRQRQPNRVQRYRDIRRWHQRPRLIRTRTNCQ